MSEALVSEDSGAALDLHHHRDRAEQEKTKCKSLQYLSRTP
jgi:hypothetical protein